MKNQLTVTIQNDKFVLTETKMVLETKTVGETEDFKELSEIVTSLGYKNAKFSDEAKIFKVSLIKRMKAQNDVKRQEREAKKAERVAAAKARVEARIAALQARLGKFGE